VSNRPSHNNNKPARHPGKRIWSDSRKTNPDRR
jgi:hypothetical protein